MYFNIQDQWVIISMMLEGHSREDTNDSPFEFEIVIIIILF